jgi:hypothetical protein
VASRKRTEITVETHEVLIIRKGDPSVRAWCSDCNAEARMIPLDEAVGLAGVSISGILQMAAAGEVHWLQAGTCTPLICLRSLVERLTVKGREPP